jgi:hypothetical protein
MHGNVIVLACHLRLPVLQYTSAHRFTICGSALSLVMGKTGIQDPSLLEKPCDGTRVHKRRARCE